MFSDLTLDPPAPVVNLWCVLAAGHERNTISSAWNQRLRSSHDWTRSTAVSDLAVLSIVGLTLALILVRPRGLNEGVWAIGGALALLLVGALPLGAALESLGELFGVVAFLVGLFWLTLAADRAGLIDACSDAIARVAGGNGRTLLLAVVLFGVLTTALFSNDGTVVLVTPVVIQLCRRLDIDPLPYAFAVTFVADSASSLVPVANPVNILFAERLDLSFGAHVAYLALPTVVAVAVTTVMLLVVMRERIPGQIVRPVDGPGRSRQLGPSARLVGAGLGLTVAGYLAAAVLQISPYWVTLAGGVVVLLPGLVTGSVDRFDPVRVQPPGLYAFVAGLALMVTAVERRGLLGQAGELVAALQNRPEIVGVMGIGVGAAIGSNLINNWTMALALIPPLEAGGASEPLVFAGLFGSDIGPNLTVVGSLATLIWMTQVRQAGMRISAWTYLRLGILTTIPALLAAMLTLAFVGSLG